MPASSANASFSRHSEGASLNMRPEPMRKMGPPPMLETIDCAIIGAGVVGLAIARALAQGGRDVVVLEREGTIGTGTSSRNSEVVHAGIYYRPDSLMARFCVEGRKALYAYCGSRGVGIERCGKLIVATTPAENERLDAIERHARGNGVDDIARLSGTEARRLEPALACVDALLSPSSGILDSHGLMVSLRGEAEEAGAMIAFHAPVLSGTVAAGRVRLEVGGTTPMTLDCGLVVNAAGLAAPAIARTIEGMPTQAVPREYFAKGSYFTHQGRVPFSRLIYPLPEPGGIGVHLTLDLDHNARFGPDVEWVETLDYAVDPRRADKFYAAIRRYWPDLRDDALQPGYAGIRPKIAPPGSAQDFVIQDRRVHGIDGLINLFGIESPGLTSSLAIADHVAALAAA